jgi:agmatine deiminase
MKFNIFLTLAVLSLLPSALIAQYHPAYKTSHERSTQLRMNEKNTQWFKTGVTMPGKVRYPGEFEESQAVCISWSYDYDNIGNITDIDTSSEFAWVSAQLAKYISDELPVFIRIKSASDSLAIKQMMETLGWSLTHNYAFIVAPIDDWWMRDFGPNGIYWGNGDSLAFVDLKYYDGRDNDNNFPQMVAKKLNARNIKTRLYAEGGNLMTDGFGKLFFSDVVNLANTEAFGWDSIQSLDTLAALFGATENINLVALECDGGTGHIDLYTKLVDEQTILAMQYPDEVTARDKRIIEDNYQLMTRLKSTYNRPFRIVRFPMPTGDNGTYNRRTCSAIEADARTFLNGITLNKTYLYPSYSNETDGNIAQTKEATTLYQKWLPGYKVIPIDARSVSPGGGSIHCITMQIPAENPVLFWHPSIDGYNDIRPSYPIEARITNRSGIATAMCKWKKRSDNNWQTVNLTFNETSGLFTGTLVPGNILATDTIDYYLEATANNGKTAVKPIAAPQGFYSITFTPYPTGNNELVLPKNHLFQAYPNPANQIIHIPYQLVYSGNITLMLKDVTGKELLELKEYKQAGNHVTEIPTHKLAAGVYFYSLEFNNEIIDTRKVLIKH